MTLTLLDDFSELDAEMAQGATITLRGDQAERYVSSRKGLEDSTNVHRMERQRQYMSAWMDALNVCLEKDGSFPSALLDAAGDCLLTDMTVNQMLDIAKLWQSYETAELETVSGETAVVDGYMQFKADDAALQAMVLELFYRPLEG